MSRSITLVTPASLAVQPGLVQLLAESTESWIPSCTEISLVDRVQTEVLDFLDARCQLDIPVGAIDARWLADFEHYLNTFYEPEQVASYLRVVRGQVCL